MLQKLFLSVGAMKAGTTWLYEQLRNHPEIYFTPEKEIHYFANVMGIENQLSHRARILKLKAVMERYARGNPAFISQNLDEIAWYAKYARSRTISNDWYVGLFSDANHRVCADFSNLYCQMDDLGWSNVRQSTAQVKVIYTLRDPIDRLWSHYKFHLKWTGREDEVLSLGVDEFINTLDKSYFWINAQYHKNYSSLRRNLNDDELMLLYFDDFRADPQRKLNDVQDFLGVQRMPVDVAGLGRKVNRTKEIPMPPDWRILAFRKLREEIDLMRSSGLWREEWTADENC